MWKTCDPGQLFVLGSHKKNKTVLPIEFFNCGYCCRTQTKYVGLSMGPDTTNAHPLPSSIIRAFSNQSHRNQSDITSLFLRQFRKMSGKSYDYVLDSKQPRENNLVEQSLVGKPPL